MYRFLAKDLRVGAPFLALILLLYLLHAPISFQMSGGYLMLGIALTLVMATGPILIDWRYEIGSFLGSLPVRRHTIVRGRYLTALVALFSGAALCFGYAALLDRWQDPEVAKAVTLLSLDAVLVFVLGQTLVLSVFLPLYFWIGAGRSIPILILVTALVWCGATALASTAAIASDFRERDIARELLTEPEQLWIKAVTTTRRRTGNWFWFAAAGGLLVLMGTGSLRFSERIYARQDL